MPPRIQFLIIVVFALVVRIAALTTGGPSLQQDPDSYAQLAITWSETGTFGFDDTGSARPTAFRPPLYPWLLSWCVSAGRLSIIGTAMLHAILGVLTVILTFMIGCRLNLKHSWLPAIAVTCDPILLRGSQLVMTETLATFLAALAWYLWLVLTCSNASKASQRHELDGYAKVSVGTALGLVLGCCVLARPTAAAWIALTAIGVITMQLFARFLKKANTAPQTRRTSWPQRLAVGLGLLTCVGLWTFRNYVALQKPVWSTTHGGYTLLLANNHLLYDHFANRGASRGWDAEPFHRAWADRKLEPDSASETDPIQRAFWYPADRDNSSTTTVSPRNFIGEIEDDQLAYTAAQATIQARPSEFVRACTYRLGWFWAAWPYSPSIGKATLAIGGWYLAWYALLAFSLIVIVRRHGWRLSTSWLPAATLIVALTIVHSVYWGNMRMRGQVMPAIFLIASSGLGIKVKSNGRAQTTQARHASK